MSKTNSFFSSSPGVISHALHALVSQIPASLEPVAADPGMRAQALAKSAALKAATISGSFTLPPGPLGLVTVIPDLLAVWRVQQQLAADIAATFGKTHALTQETMAICLFKHGGAALTSRLFSRVGDDIVVQRIANRTLHQLLEKIGLRVAQRLAAKSVSRWVPILGAVGAGAYAYFDTTHVAANAIELFSKQVRLETATTEPTMELAAEAVASPPSATRRRKPKAKQSPASKTKRPKANKRKPAKNSS